METAMKEYTIDLGVWRCGGHKEFSVGPGGTMLLNAMGGMCCLGQFAEQDGVSREDLIGRGQPRDIDRYNELFVNFHRENTGLSIILMRINDNEETDPWTKLCEISEVLNRNEIKLLVTGDLPASSRSGDLERV